MIDSDRQTIMEMQTEGVNKHVCNLDRKTQAGRLFTQLLKFRLSLNDCKNNGFVLCNFGALANAVSLEELVHKNDFSRQEFEKEVLLRARKWKKEVERQQKKQAHDL